MFLCSQTVNLFSLSLYAFETAYLRLPLSLPLPFIFPVPLMPLLAPTT